MPARSFLPKAPSLIDWTLISFYACRNSRHSKTAASAPHGGTLRIDKPPSRMFTEVTQHTLEKFKAVYHQTTKYSNPIIESVLYGDNRGRIYFYGDLAAGNYLIFHRSGFAHINFNDFDENINTLLFQEMDAFIRCNEE